MANTYLTRTPTTENIDKLTLSCWVKRSSITSSAQRIFSNASSEYLFYRFDSNEKFRFTIVVDGNETTLRTERVFRDTSAWYNIVVRWDTTQSTEADRIQIWVNGVRETSFSLATYPALNSTSDMFNSGTPFEIGRYATGNSEYFDGSLSHLHCCSGYAYDATAFGSFDANGVWKINTSPSVTYGTNGFFILKDGNSVTDQSGEGNNFTVGGGTLTNTEDSPSNVFATFNPLIGLHSNGSTLVPNLEAGNTDAWYNSTAWRIAQSTLGASSGKYYAEFKQSNDYGTDYSYVGIWDIDAYAQKISGYPYMADMANCYGYYNVNGQISTGGSGNAYGNSYGNGNIIGIAMDLDNNKCYWSKDGTWQNSANPSNGTGGYSITANKTYAMGIQFWNNAWRANFGNGYFGTTAVASAGTNASGIGIFEYDVPTGYTALSTKGLNL